MWRYRDSHRLMFQRCAKFLAIVMMVVPVLVLVCNFMMPSVSAVSLMRDHQEMALVKCQGQANREERKPCSLSQILDQSTTVSSPTPSLRVFHQGLSLFMAQRTFLNSPRVPLLQQPSLAPLGTSLVSQKVMLRV